MHLNINLTSPMYLPGGGCNCGGRARSNILNVFVATSLGSIEGSTAKTLIVCSPNPSTSIFPLLATVSEVSVGLEPSVVKNIVELGVEQCTNNSAEVVNVSRSGPITGVATFASTARKAQFCNQCKEGKRQHMHGT